MQLIPIRICLDEIVRHSNVHGTANTTRKNIYIVAHGSTLSVHRCLLDRPISRAMTYENNVALTGLD